MTQFVSNREIYERVICGVVPQVRERLWIATADIKDMYVPPTHAMRATEARFGGRDMVPFLEVLDGMLKRGVEVRLIHAKEPGPNWREDFDRYPDLWQGMERMLCPRVHFKCIIVDGCRAYFGSACLIGAGGARASTTCRRLDQSNLCLHGSRHFCIMVSVSLSKLAPSGWNGCCGCGAGVLCGEKDQEMRVSLVDIIAKAFAQNASAVSVC